MQTPWMKLRRWNGSVEPPAQVRAFSSRPSPPRWAGERASRQGLVQIRDEICRIFQPDRKAHDFRAGAGRDFLRVRELSMGRGSRMDHERARIAEIGEVGEQFELAYKRYAGLVAALDSEGEHGAGALGAIFARELVVAVAGQARVADPGDGVVFAQMLSDA